MDIDSTVRQQVRQVRELVKQIHDTRSDREYTRGIQCLNRYERVLTRTLKAEQELIDEDDLTAKERTKLKEKVLRNYDVLDEILNELDAMLGVPQPTEEQRQAMKELAAAKQTHQNMLDANTACRQKGLMPPFSRDTLRRSRRYISTIEARVVQ